MSLRDKLNQIHNIDCLELLKQLPDESIDCVITDPPYMGVVNEDWDKQWKSIDEYTDWCNEWITESSRVLKKSGSFYIFGFSYQLSKLINTFENNGFKFKQDIVVWKGMQSAAGRISKNLKMFPTTTEHIHFYFKDSKNYIRDLLQQHRQKLNLSAKEINEYLGKASNGGGTWSGIAGLKQKTLQEPTREDWHKLDKLFGGLPDYDDIVYKFNVPFGITDVIDDIDFYDRNYRKEKFHPTQKPIPLMKRIIECGTNPNDIVLDLFGGSGSTAIACQELNRRYIVSELDSEMVDKANQWLVHNQEKTKFFKQS